MISATDLSNITSNVSETNQSITINVINFNWDSLFQFPADHPLAIFLFLLGLIILIRIDLFVSALGTIYYAITRSSFRKKENEEESKRQQPETTWTDEQGNVIDAEYRVIDRESSDKK